MQLAVKSDSTWTQSFLFVSFFNGSDLTYDLEPTPPLFSGAKACFYRDLDLGLGTWYQDLGLVPRPGLCT